PLLELHELERVRRGREALREEIVRIERDRCDERVELVGGERRLVLVGRRGCRRRGRLCEDQRLAGHEQDRASDRHERPAGFEAGREESASPHDHTSLVDEKSTTNLAARYFTKVQHPGSGSCARVPRITEDSMRKSAALSLVVVALLL